jgi:hypothetical protein
MRKYQIFGLVFLAMVFWQNPAAAKTWFQQGGSLNSSSTVNASLPSLAMSNGTPYVALVENTGSGNALLYVRYWNGSAWVQVGGSLNEDPAGDPVADDGLYHSLAIYNGKPYVAWEELNAAGKYYAYEKHWNGSTWVKDGAAGAGNGNFNVNHDRATILST